MSTKKNITKPSTAKQIMDALKIPKAMREKAKQMAKEIMEKKK